MAEGEFSNTIKALVLFVAFSMLIITVAIDFGSEYDRSSDEIGNGSLNVLDFKTTAEGVNDEAQSYRSRFESGDVDDIDDASGMFSVATDIITMITTPFTLLGQILVNVFHVPPLVIGIFLGLLAIALILGIWRLLRAGS